MRKVLHEIDREQRQHHVKAIQKAQISKDMQYLATWAGKFVLSKGNPQLGPPTEESELYLIRCVLSCIISLQRHKKGYEVADSIFGNILQACHRTLAWEYTKDRMSSTPPPQPTTAQAASLSSGPMINPLASAAKPISKIVFIADSRKREALIYSLEKLKLYVCFLMYYAGIQYASKRLSLLHHVYKHVCVANDMTVKQLKQGEYMDTLAAAVMSRLETLTLDYVIGNLNLAPLLQANSLQLRSAALMIVFMRHDRMHELFERALKTEVVTRSDLVRAVADMESTLNNLLRMSHNASDVKEYGEEILTLLEHLVLMLFCDYDDAVRHFISSRITSRLYL